MFTYQLPPKIIFGQPALEALIAELKPLDIQRLLLVSDPGLERIGLVDDFQQGLVEAGWTVQTFCEIETNPTTDSVHRALALLKAENLELLVGLGGGSAIDVAKATAMLAANGGTYADYQWHGRPITKFSRPLIAIPTTAGTGSEVSKVAVIVDQDNPFKKGVLSPKMFARTAILDPTLTLSLPPRLTAATGIDALTHALETYLGRQANPHTDLLAVGAMRLIRQFLPQAVAHSDDREARSRMLLASLWAGTAMDNAGLGLIHALSGPLTSHLHLHHGLANGLILPHVLRFNLPDVAGERSQTLKEIFGLPSAATYEALVSAVASFVAGLDLPVRLGDLDVSLAEIDWDAIAEETTRMVLINNNPRPASAADCRTLLDEMI